MLLSVKVDGEIVYGIDKSTAFSKHSSMKPSIHLATCTVSSTTPVLFVMG